MLAEKICFSVLDEKGGRVEMIRLLVLEASMQACKQDEGVHVLRFRYVLRKQRQRQGVALLSPLSLLLVPVPVLVGFCGLIPRSGEGRARTLSRSALFGGSEVDCLFLFHED